MKKHWRMPGWALLLWIAGGCGHPSAGEEPGELPAPPPAVRILPLIDHTRVTDTHFETGDTIGVTIRQQTGTCYLDNGAFRFDGTQFAAEGVLWYNSREGTATLTACYPYHAAGVPGQFTVRSDQREASAYDASDLLGARSTEITPSAEAVQMTFRHLLSRIRIEVEADEEVQIQRIALGGLLPTVAVDWEQLTTGAASGTETEILACAKEPGSDYAALVPPQTAAMQVTVQTEWHTFTKRLVQLEMRSGMSYTLQLTVSDEESFEVAVKGEIEHWGDGGQLTEDPEAAPGGQQPGTGTLSYGGVSYRTATIGGREWMAENLRYQPAGGKVYYPARDDDQGLADVETNGLLYPYATALAGAPEGTEPVQGICPEGWQLPTIDELTALAAAADAEFFTLAGHFYALSGGAPQYAQAQSYLLSSTLSGGRLSYLELKTKQPTTLPSANIAASIRCVKAQ